MDESADMVTVRVIDQGIGIPSSDISRLFQPFTQLGVEPTTCGVGLGLYIARVIVELHGRWIAAKSDGERGSVFSVGLPRWLAD